MEPIAGSSAADLTPVTKRKIPLKSTGKKYQVFLKSKYLTTVHNHVLKFEYLLGDSEMTPVEKVSEAAPKTVKKPVKKAKKKAAAKPKKTSSEPEISTTGKSF